MTKAKTLSRLLALIMAAAMAVTLLPLSALAVEGDDDALAVEETLPPVEEESLGSTTDGLIPFEPVLNEAPMSLAATAGTAAPDYFAVEGDLAVPIYKYVYADEAMSFPSSSWIEVTLTSTGTSAEPLTCDFYTVSNSNSYYRPVGALFLGETPAGIYDISYNSTPFATLEVVESDSSRVLSLGGASISRGSVDLGGGSPDFNWLTNLFEQGSVGSLYDNHDTHYYDKDSDGNVCLSLIAKGIVPGAVTEISDGITSFGYIVIPARNYGETQQYYIKLSDSGDMTGEQIFTVTVGDEVYSATLNSYPYSRFWLDISQLDQLKLGIVPADAASAPDSISVQIYDEYYYIGNSSANQLFESTTALQNGRYTIELESGIYLYEKFNPQVYLEYSDGTYSLNMQRALNIAFPTSTSYLFNDVTAQIRADIDSQRFIVSQNYNGSVFRDDFSFSLVDSDFAPVQGAAITQDVQEGDWPGQEYFKFTATQPLTVGETYYLRLGALPIQKLIAVDSLENADSSNQIYGYQIYASSAFSFEVYAPNSTVVPAEWGVKIIKQQSGEPDAGTIYSISNGKLTSFSSSPQQSTFTTTSLSEGVYAIEYLRNGNTVTASNTSNANEFRYVSPRFITIPPAASSLRVTSAGFSYNWNTNTATFDVSG
ncbi:MAG: hypothetical protein LBJ84_03955, partial [Oscillospiraceae bacterium]|nr:hypothetical protein [Oscillospiraceae bacterium]